MCEWNLFVDFRNVVDFMFFVLELWVFLFMVFKMMVGGVYGIMIYYLYKFGNVR